MALDFNALQTAQTQAPAQFNSQGVQTNVGQSTAAYNQATQPTQQQPTATQTPTAPTQTPQPTPQAPAPAPAPQPTASGQPASLSGLVGTRPSAVNPQATEYFNTQTGQGFATPQDLSTFANQYGAQTTSQNVFDYFKSNFTNLNNAFQKVSGPPPQTQGEASSAINGLLSDTKDSSANTNALNFLGGNTTIQSAIETVKSYLTPTVSAATLQSYVNQLQTDQNVLQGLNTQMMSLKTVMDGSEQDIRNEITASGGFATNSQIAALTVARNKTLLQQATMLQNQISTATQTVNNDQSLLQNEKDIANTEFSQNSTILNAAQQLQTQILNAQKDGLNTIIQSVGLGGLVNGLMNADPTGTQLNSAAKLLGMTGDQLKQAGLQNEAQNNLKQFKDYGVTSPYVVTSQGEVIDTKTGLPFSSPQEFQQKTGLTLQQANAKKLIAPLVNTTQQLDQQAKLASINASNTSAAKSGYELNFEQTHGGLTPEAYASQQQAQIKAANEQGQNLLNDAAKYVSAFAGNGKVDGMPITWGGAWNYLHTKYPDASTETIDNLLRADLYRNKQFGG